LQTLLKQWRDIVEVVQGIALNPNGFAKTKVRWGPIPEEKSKLLADVLKEYGFKGQY